MIKVTMTFETYDEMLAQFGAVRLDSIQQVEETVAAEPEVVEPPVARGATSEMAAAREIPGVKENAAPEPPAGEPEPEKVVVPRAQELADKYGIDPMALPASGKGNRVLLSDVQKAVDQMGLDVKPEPEPEQPAADDDTEYTVDHGRIATSFLVEAKGLPAAQSLLTEFDAKRVKDVQDMNAYVKRCIEESGKAHSDWQTFLADKTEAA